MKRLLYLLSFCLALNQASALPSFDPFADATPTGTTYAIGSNLIGQTNSAGDGWLSVGTGTAQPVIAAGNLIHSSLPASTGNSVSFPPSTGLLARWKLNATVTSGKIYYSFLFKATNISVLSASGVFFAGFSDTANSQTAGLSRAGARLYAKTSGAGYVLGVSQDNVVNADLAFDSTVRNVNEVLFIVASIEFNPAGITNSSLWINPDTNTFSTLTPPTPNANATAGTNLANVKAFVIGCRNAAQLGGIFDELRVGTTWAYVTGGDPAILESPISRSLPPGVTTTFNVVARGTPTLSYQWIKDGSTVLVDDAVVSGATTASLTLTDISLGDAGSYSVLVTNGLGNSVTSSPAILAVSDPAITSQPQSQINDYGTTATFSVVAGGTPPLTYQWQKNGVNLPNGGNVSGATSGTLTLSGVTYLDAGNYSVIVTNGSASTITSSNALLTVRDPFISSQPSSRTNVAGTSATFSVGAAGTPTLTYQWKRGGTNMVDGGNISGATSSTLTLSSVTQSDATSYTVVVTSGSTSNVTSSAALLTVLDPPTVVAQPQTRSVIVGDNISFAVGVTGTAPFGYQWWYVNAGPVPISGANLASYSLTNVQTTNAGGYFVVITNSVGGATSSVANLFVSATRPLLSETNLVVLRLGDGAQTLANTGNSISFDQFTRAGTYVNTIPIPDSGASSLIQNGVGVTEGQLTISMDRRLLTFVGYNTNRPYSANVSSSASATVPRGIATLNSASVYNLAITSSTAFSPNAIRSAVTDGTNNFWAAGSDKGTRYFTTSVDNLQIQADTLNSRVMQIFNGDLYFSTAAVPTFGIHKFLGLPTAPTTDTVLLATGDTNSFPYDYAFNPAGTIVYVTEDGTGGGTTPNMPGIIKWTYDSGSSSWISNYTIISGTGTRGLVGDFSGSPAVLYATTTETSANRLIKISDTGAGATATTLAAAGANQVFRGVKFGPIETIASPTLFVNRSGNNITLSWSGSFTLQSSTNVAGVYSNVSGATSPFTTNVTSSVQLFFRLRN